MRITGADIQLSSSREFRQTESRQERLEIRLGPSTPPPRPELEISTRARELAVQLSADESPLLAPQEAAAADESAARGDPNLSLLIGLIETLTGRPVRLFDASALGSAPAAEASVAAAAQAGSQAATPSTDPGFSVDYQARQTRSEYERTSVQAQGEIQTADGERIRFSLSLQMERAYSETTELRFTAGAAAERKDPLVINFDGRAAQLTDQRFEFDLDADGQTERLPLLSGGSGLLAFDRNGDGRINDGRELFGALSGDGFGDLIALDSDGSGWIDSGDTLFGQLRVWMPDPTAADDSERGRLMTLEEAGVGAISLSSISSAFDLRGSGNSDLGQIRSTGLYVSTAREVGTVQQIDFSV